jgi:alkyl sulfatase BDS1-like metallo-beta-lactamase superfamily hydrolase
MELFGVEAKLLFASHNWPRWGGTDLMGFLALQRHQYR